MGGSRNGSKAKTGIFSLQNGASYCTSELAVLKNNEIHTWDRGFDDEGTQVSLLLQFHYRTQYTTLSLNILQIDLLNHILGLGGEKRAL